MVLYSAVWREQRQDIMSSTPLSWECVRVAAGRGSYFMRDPNLILGAKAKSRLACHILRPLKTQNPCPDSRCWRLPFFLQAGQLITNVKRTLANTVIEESLPDFSNDVAMERM